MNVRHSGTGIDHKLMSIEGECVKVTVALPVQQIIDGVPELHCKEGHRWATGLRNAFQ